MRTKYARKKVMNNYEEQETFLSELNALDNLKIFYLGDNNTIIIHKI